MAALFDDMASMKRAVILHGTDGSPDENWFPWLKGELERRGFEVWVPLLPDNHTPNRKTYNNFLHESGWNFAENLVIGHSSGAVSILNMLDDDRFPAIDTAVLVGAWLRNIPNSVIDVERFGDLFPPKGFDFEKIKSKASHLLMLHGEDDPFCPVEQARELSHLLDAKLKVIADGLHFSAGLDPRFTKIPELINLLEKSESL